MFIPDLEYKLLLKSLPILCVDLLIVYDGKCLLLKRRNEPANGQFWFPGGRIYKMESIKEAALRKAKEETNLLCEFVKIVSVEETIFMKSKNMPTDIHTVNICCHLIPEEIIQIEIDKNHSDFKWINKQDDSLHPAVIHPLALVGIL